MNLKSWQFTIIVALLSIALASLSIAQGQEASEDTTIPSDVENVQAVAGDEEVTLTWDVATDNVGVVNYKIYYGTEEITKAGDIYEFGPISTGDTVTYTVTGLTNGITYYFAVIAVDEAGNESDDYSIVQSAMPDAELRGSSIEDDGENPRATKAEATDKDKLKVTFSEPILLPLEAPEDSFTIQRVDNPETTIEVENAALDPEDEDGVVVLLQTSPQEAGVEYELFVGIEIKDFYENTVQPLEEDVPDEDRVRFMGFEEDVAKPEPIQNPIPAPEDKTPPTVTGIEADSNTKFVVRFSEAVSLGSNPKERFLVVTKDEEDPLEIKNVSLGTDKKSVFVTTAAQKPVDYKVTVLGIKDEAGNAMNQFEAQFKGKGTSLTDLIAPEDITNLIAKIKNAGENIVELKWKKSKDSAGDLKEQILYQSLNAGITYDKGTALGEETDIAEVRNLVPGQRYTFKVTTKDDSDNESKGRIVSILLPATGPALGIALALSLGAGIQTRRRNKKRRK
jgi:hypothetical protein